MIAVALLGFGICQVTAGDEKLDKKFVEDTIVAAEKGDATAQCALGACFEAGKGMLKDYEEAAKWYRRAATQGDAMAECALAACYEKGRGVTQDLAEAAKWYTQAAEQGFTRAQTKLGGFYAEGTGVGKDLTQAYHWYSVAAAKGDEVARKALPKVQKKLTPAQLAAAKPALESAASVPSPVAGQKFSALPPPAATNHPATQGTGEGFFVTEDGFFITAAHLIKGTPLIQLVTQTGRVAAKVAKVDPVDDLALLKAEGKFTPLPVAPSRAVRAGARVVSVAFPVSHPEPLTALPANGQITALSGVSDDPRFFQAAIPLGPAGSGTALTDEHANVIGVLLASPLAETGLAEGVHQALKSSFLLGFLESVPEASAKLVEPHAGTVDPSTVTEAVQAGSALVLVY